MARRTTAPTSSTIYLAKFDQADNDLGGTTANRSPVILSGLQGSTYVQLSFAGDSASKTFTWHLNLVDTKLDRVIRTISFTSEATARRTAMDNGSGLYLHNDKIIDIGGTGSSGNDQLQWVLSLNGIDADTGAYLMRYAPARLEG